MSDNPFLPPPGVSKLKFQFLMWKRYFDTGLSITGYLKYGIALFGISSLDVGKTIAIAVIYVPFCFVIGYLWFRWNFAELDNEISNRFNYFMREMREAVVNKK